MSTSARQKICSTAASGEAPKSDRIVASSLKLAAKLRPARVARMESYAQKLVRSSSLKARELGAFAKLEWLTGVFNNEDDLIQARHWNIQLPSPELAAIRAMAGEPLPSPAGTLASAMKRLDFTGDGGKYRARLHWRVST